MGEAYRGNRGIFLAGRPLTICLSLLRADRQCRARRGLWAALAVPVIALGSLALPRTGEAAVALRPVSGLPSAFEPVAETGQDEQIVAQKLSLLQAYLASDSIRRIRNGDDAEAVALLDDAENRLEMAGIAQREGRLSDAGAALDEGLRLATTANGRAGKPRRSSEEEQARYETLHGQIRSYLDAVSDALGEEGPGDETARVVERIGAIVADARQLADKGQHAAANRLLEQAYQTTVMLVSRLRKGATLVASLNFASPAEELEYERRRYGSYEMLVAIVLDRQDGGDGALRTMADRYLAASRAVRDRADQQARSGEVKAAIVSMEEATGWLIRILRAANLPIPE